MLVKFELDSTQVDLLKALTGERVASKACMFAALEAVSLTAEVSDLRRIITEQRIEIDRLRSVIEQARASAAQLLEKTAQTDIFS